MDLPKSIGAHVILSHDPDAGRGAAGFNVSRARTGSCFDLFFLVKSLCLPFGMDILGCVHLKHETFFF